MSRINAGLYSSEKQDWLTPVHVWKSILDFEGRTEFDVDAACTVFNIPAIWHITETGIYGPNDMVEDGCGLTSDWDFESKDNLVFLNPPYGAELKKFMQKAYQEAQKGRRIWLLIPSRTETQYQHTYGITQAGFSIFLKGRLHFLRDGEDVGTAPFPTLLLYFGEDFKEKAKRWIKNPALTGTLLINPQVWSKG